MTTPWPQVVRVVHLGGGLRAVSEPQKKVFLEPHSPEGTIAVDLDDFGSLYGVIEKHLHLKVIGCDFFELKEQVLGYMPPEWRPFNRARNLGWATNDAAQVWSEISHAAFRANNLVLAQQARHISTQLRICIARLRDLSEKYHQHLSAMVEGGAYRETRGYTGNFTDEIFISVHAALFELCTLRDFITGFVGYAVFGAANLGLGSFLKRARGGQDKPAIVAQILDAAKDEDNDEGWLHLLTEYRNLITHNAPLADAHGVVMVRHINISVGEKCFAPSVSLPLPNSPKVLRKRFAQPSAFETSEEWLGASRSLMGEEGRDALQFCHAALFNLAELARDAAALSPLQPTPIVFDDRTIVRGSLTLR